MLDPDLDASCDGPTPCESELGYAAHAKTKCADSVRLQYAGFRYESLFGKGFVSQAVPPAAGDENKFIQDREAARFTAAEQPIKSLNAEGRR
jgi:hypothetical protein